MSSPAPTDVLTPEEAAEVLGVSPKAFVEMCRTGQIPGARRVGRRWRVTRGHLRWWMGKHRPAGYVYFVAHGKGGPIKIGWTVRPNLSRRLRSMQSGTPVKLVPEAFLRAETLAVERELHEQFAEHRIRGEWFEREPVVAWLEENGWLGVFDG